MALIEHALRILVVEDSEDDYQLLLRQLKNDGLNCTCRRVEDETSFREALREVWDLVISDFSLPQFCGLTALRLLRDGGSDLPFIIFSGTIGEDSAVQAMKAGANDYIMKSHPTKLPRAVLREVGTARDRAVQRETEAHLKEMEDQLRQSQKMEAIGRLAGGVAHDFNNMLTIIGLQCEKLLDHPDDQVTNAARKIISIQQRAAGFSQQLLSISRGKSLSGSTLDLNATAAALRETLENLAGDGIELRYELSEPALATAEKTPIEQLIVNLVVNARDAMNGMGRLFIRTRRVTVEAPRATAMGPLPAGTYTALEISDNGCGIDPAVLPKIFEPFFTTKPAGQGTGFGLSLVYGIARQSGAAITVVSRPGEGSTFTVYFPSPEENGQRHSPTARPR